MTFVDPTTLPVVDDATYRLYVRDEATMERVAEIDDFEEFDAVLRFNDASTWVLTLNREHRAAQFLEMGTGGIVLTRGGRTVLSGPVLAAEDTIGPDGETRQASGIDDTGMLAQRVALPDPYGPPYTVAYDSFVGTAEDALRYYVDRNAGPSATPERRMSGLTVGSPSGIGTSSEFVAIGDELTVAATATYTVPRPPSIRKGDVLLMFLNLGGATGQTTVLTGPNGWIKQTDVTYGSDNRCYIYSHTVGENETAVLNDTWRATDPGHCQARQAAWRGSGGLSVVGAAGQVQPSTTAPSTPSLTTPGSNCRLVAFYSDDNNVQSVTPPAGFAERWDFDWGYGMSDAVQALPGASGGKVATVATVDNFAAMLVALQPTNPSGANEITAQARFDNLLELLQSISVQGGGLRFQIQQSGAGRAFSVTRPRDLADTIIFSRELSTVETTKREREGPLANYIIAGGGGEGTQREFVERGDASSLGLWRAEQFIDGRSKTGSDLGQMIDEALERGSPHVGYTLEPVDGETIRFGRDYQLGDVVATVVDGSAFIATVRQVNLHLDASGGTATPTLNPSASVGRSRGFSIGRLTKRLSQIERNAENFTLGMVMQWTRGIDSIPSGWALCDSTLGTVDMRGRFPVGADPTNAAGRGTYALGGVGGAVTTTIGNHNHGMQNHVHPGPNHNHGMQSHAHPADHGHPGATTGPMDHFSDNILVSGSGRDRAHDHSTNTPSTSGFSTGGPNNNTTTDAGTGSTGGPNNNTTTDAGASTPSIIPPYTALHFIQRIST